MNDLEIIYVKDDGRTIQKSSHFLNVYDNLFSGYRKAPVLLVEVGVGNGGSLKMWKEYFGSQARIIGIDIADCVVCEEEQILFIRGDQAEVFFLESLAPRVQDAHIIIDDGSHKCQDQILTFEKLFPELRRGGLYVCEDVHTSYRQAYGGGYRRKGTFIEYCKDMIDMLHCTELPEIPQNNLCNQIESITFYRSMAVIKKIGGC